jgi:penicillin-binding protein 1A
MSADSALELVDMMRGVVSQGTGTLVKTRFGIVADIAGKTGTTQNNTDGWFILMHPQLVAGAWVGFNDSRVTMRSNYWGQGGHNAILLVGDFFRDTLKAGLIDAKASFASTRRSPPLLASWSQASTLADKETGAEIMRLETGPAGAQDEEPPTNADEVDRALSKLSGATPLSRSPSPVAEPEPGSPPVPLLRFSSDTQAAPAAID